MINHKQHLISGISLLTFGLFMLSASTAAMARDHDHSNQMHQPAPLVKAADVVRDPSDLPPPIGNRSPALVRVTLTSKELVGVLDPANGTTYRYWTFNGKVAAPFIRVKQGDTVEVTLVNEKESQMVHSIDFHAAIGPGGGAAFTQVPPGQSKTFAFQVNTPGLFVYHCGSPMIAEHIANGMYGMILVEPKEGLPPVDHEYYLMQGEIYTEQPKGKTGLQQFSPEKLAREAPEYFIMNGAVDAITKEFPMHAKVGETVRIYFGNAGPNATASTHMVGEIFTRYWALGSLTTPAMSGIQTATVPSGGAAIIEIKASKPGNFAIMDHAIARMEKGDMAVLQVKGDDDPALMHAGAATPAPGMQEVSGVTAQDADEVNHIRETAVTLSPAESMDAMHMGMSDMPGMSSAPGSAPTTQPFSLKSLDGLIGCLTLQNDGKAMLNVFRSSKVYRLEAQPVLFSENAGRLVHVTGHFGSVLPKENAHVPSYVVDRVEAIMANCSAKTTVADLEKIMAPPEAPVGAEVGMGSMSFSPATVTINAGEQVVWKNTSSFYHNVVNDPARALRRVDVSSPTGTTPFASVMLQPGTNFYHVFDKPGIYHYVCVVHENSGMKGTVIVRPAPLLASRTK
jgi:copper-containing nitrite reductase